MKVSIIEKETGKEICRYPIVQKGLNYTPSEEEYFSGAWQTAVDDKVVDAKNRDKYKFLINK